MLLQVVLRSWYEKNKHIYPATRWEAFEPKKKYDITAEDDIRRSGVTNYYTSEDEDVVEVGMCIGLVGSLQRPPRLQEHRTEGKTATRTLHLLCCTYD